LKGILKNLKLAVVLSAASVWGTHAIAQTQPSAPSAASSPQPAANAVPSAPAAKIPELPPADPKNFTAASPKPETVNAFLRQLWGYDPNRTWRVAGVQSTAAPGVSRVTVWVLEKVPGSQIQSMIFLVTPDGNHAIEGVNVISFGEKPFAATRELLRAETNGAYEGSPSKDFELVEFVDLQCPHCKIAQGVMEQLAKDFPKAHVAVELFPLVNIHPSAYKAAKYAVCAQQTSNDAFFKYIHEVFDTQEGLAPMTDDALLKAAAARAGLDGNALSTCANSQSARDSVDAQMRLALSAGVDQTPLLAIDGRMLPEFNSIPYDQLKKIVQYQATLDGVDSGATAETLAPSQPQPKLQDLPK
jgi:protein-disulfide isomerase